MHHGEGGGMGKGESVRGLCVFVLFVQDVARKSIDDSACQCEWAGAASGVCGRGGHDASHAYGSGWQSLLHARGYGLSQGRAAV